MSRRLQDELRAAAEESDDYSLLKRAADALDRAERAHVDAWDTEGCLVVWGTHESVVAYEAFREHCDRMSYDPGDHPTASQWHHGASKRWARPDLRFMEGSWPDTAHGPLPVEGWTPYLVLAL